MRTSLVAALWTLSATVAEAQYRRTPGDTLRLRELTTSRSIFTTPSGPIALRSEHDATIAITFGMADSARAWYESLRIAMSTPQGRQTPGTRAALRKPFDLTFDARGRIRTLRAPEFPAAFEGVTDLSHQFDDLLVRLPAVPLARDVAWSDTAVIESRPATGGSVRSEHLISARVVRDTVIDGDLAWVIELLQRITVNGTQPMKGQPLSARTSLSGSDSGTVVFSTASGRMLARQRTGHLTGSVTYEGGPKPMVMPMEQSYENSVTRVP